MSNIWTTRDGREVAYGDLEDDHLGSILRMLKRKAVKAWRDTGQVADTWVVFAHSSWYGLKAEADRRDLQWEEVGHVDLIDRSHLEREVVGALRDCVNAHGPITHDTAPSAAKRVIGVIKSHNRRIREDVQDVPEVVADRTARALL